MDLCAAVSSWREIQDEGLVNGLSAGLQGVEQEVNKNPELK